MEIITIETPALGDRSYLLTDGTMAAMIDPQRDIDRIELVLNEHGFRLTHVFETHRHNDYVSGGLDLSRRTGATYVQAGGDEAPYEHVAACHGDEFVVGDVVVRAIHTPGHTPTHLSYLASDGDTPVAVFTGGSMLYGTVGRTDLIGADATETLTRAQFQSVRRLAEALPGEVGVHPTHGFGSFCSSASASGSDASTIAQERRSNLALILDDEDAFVDRLLGGLTAYPRYYAQMAAINRDGPAPVDLSPPEEVDPAELRRRIHAGEWVVDLRARAAFAHDHLAGTVNVELGDSFATYLGWTLRWGTPVTIVGDTTREVADAQRQMVRIGIDRPAGAAHGGLVVWGAQGEIRRYRTATFGDLGDVIADESIVVVDVRRDDEWAAGRIHRAIHIPLHDLESRLNEIPDGTVWVHCASGYRASIAASLLDRAGRTVVAVDDQWAAATKQESSPSRLLIAQG